VDLHVLIHELAHELKNPMVTIKTFAQLLSDRYEDEHFRARFQDVVGGDIERMDDLLEIMIEFADFSQPRVTKLSLGDRLRFAVEEISSECAKRQVAVRWTGSSTGREIRADEAQLKYILRNVLLAVLSQTRVGSEIDIDVNSTGPVTIAYTREGARITSLTHYFGVSPGSTGEIILPLRMLLAKQLVERNGGEMVIEPSEGEREIVRMEFPIA
jgi:signal transduction histidine kinase